MANLSWHLLETFQKIHPICWRMASLLGDCTCIIFVTHTSLNHSVQLYNLSNCRYIKIIFFCMLQYHTTPLHSTVLSQNKCCDLRVFWCQILFWKWWRCQKWQIWSMLWLWMVYETLNKTKAETYHETKFIKPQIQDFLHHQIKVVRIDNMST